MDVESVQGFSLRNNAIKYKAYMHDPADRVVTKRHPLPMLRIDVRHENLMPCDDSNQAAMITLIDYIRVSKVLCLNSISNRGYEKDGILATFQPSIWVYDYQLEKAFIQNNIETQEMTDPPAKKHVMKLHAAITFIRKLQFFKS